ncbi:hypothetical protein PanWU01x14_304830, partial [Parasponia andersonii]
KDVHIITILQIQWNNSATSVYLIQWNNSWRLVSRFDNHWTTTNVLPVV